MVGIAAMAGYVALLSGTSGTQDWAVQGKHQRVGGMPGGCFAMHTEDATTHQGGGDGGECLAGSGALSGQGNVLPLGAKETSGDTVTCNVVGGVTVASGRTARVTFEDGKHVTVKVVEGPTGWRKIAGQRVRYYGRDVLPITTAVQTSVTVYDAHHHRVGHFRQPG